MTQNEKFFDHQRDGITQSLLSTFQRCRVEAGLVLQGWTPKQVTSAGLTFGTIIHGILEEVYNDIRTRKLKAIPLDKEYRRYFGIVERKWRNDNPFPSNDSCRVLEDSLCIAEATLPLYFNKWWKHDYNKIQWRATEQEFRIPFLSSQGFKTTLRGKKDGVFSSPKLWLFETKGKSLINEANLIETLHFEFQVNFYLYAMKRIYNEQPQGVLYNIIRRTSLERKKGETYPQYSKRIKEDIVKRPDFYFIRYEILVTKAEMKLFETQLDGLVNDFINWLEKRSATYPDTNNCITKYGRCSMLPICSKGDYRYHTKRKTVHKELEET